MEWETELLVRLVVNTVDDQGCRRRIVDVANTIAFFHHRASASLTSS